MVKLFSLCLMAPGGLIEVAAIALLRPAYVPAFVAAAFTVELLGLVLLSRAHTEEISFAARRERRY